MSFYDPENFTDPLAIAYEKQHRILQPVWDLIKDGHEDALRSPLFPPILAVVFYLVGTLPFTFFDVVGQNSAFLRKYLLQPNRPPVSWGMVKAIYGNAFWNHILLIVPMALVQLIWVPPTPLPEVAPTLFQFVWHQIAFFVIFDFEYWAWHALHHKVRFLYRWCHSVHHQYHSPFALITQFLHPWEIFCVGLGISVTPWFFFPHCMTYWSWFILSTYVSIEVHCGYDMPWAAHNWCPFYGGAPKHDLHHLRPLTNFQPWMSTIDRLLGWSLTYEELAEMKSKRAAEIGVYEKSAVEGLKVWN